MKRKILLGLASFVVVAAGVAAISAGEAHIINVTATIENALNVDNYGLDFGTVFPQEELERQFTISLSESFKAQSGADIVEYEIVQKPKHWRDQDFCRFLSKLPQEKEDGDVEEKSYYDDKDTVTTTDDSCQTATTQAIGQLGGGDISDTWIVDLKVPPIAGYVGQDWPESCRQDWVVPAEDDYGCDLWVEVTDINR